MINQINLTLENLINRINLVEAWEIRETLFNNVIATSQNFETLNEALDTLKSNFAGQQISIKAGSLDKNGKLANNSKVFNFTIPTEDNEVINLQTFPQHQQQVIYSGLKGINQQYKIQSPEDFTTALKGIEERLTDKYEVRFKELELELKYENKIKEVERLKRELEKERKALIEEKQAYQEKNAKILPAGKDILNGLADMFFNKKTENLNNVPEKTEIETKNKTMTFKIKEPETKEIENKNDKQKLLEIFENLSEEEQDAFLNEIFENEDDKTSEDEATNKEIETSEDEKKESEIIIN